MAMVCTASVSLRALLRDALSRDGTVMFFPENGTEAVAILARKKPGLVLLDERFQGDSTLSLLQQLREVTHDHHACIMLLADRIERAQILPLMRAGLADVVTKPVDTEVLLIRANQRAWYPESSERPTVAALIDKPATLTWENEIRLPAHLKQLSEHDFLVHSDLDIPTGALVELRCDVLKEAGIDGCFGRIRSIAQPSPLLPQYAISVEIWGPPNNEREALRRLVARGQRYR